MADAVKYLVSGIKYPALMVVVARSSAAHFPHGCPVAVTTQKMFETVTSWMVTAIWCGFYISGFGPSSTAATADGVGSVSITTTFPDVVERNARTDFSVNISSSFTEDVSVFVKYAIVDDDGYSVFHDSSDGICMHGNSNEIVPIHFTYKSWRRGYFTAHIRALPYISNVCDQSNVPEQTHLDNFEPEKTKTVFIKQSKLYITATGPELARVNQDVTIHTIVHNTESTVQATVVTVEPPGTSRIFRKEICVEANSETPVDFTVSFTQEGDAIPEIDADTTTSSSACGPRHVNTLQLCDAAFPVYIYVAKAIP